MDIMQLFLLCFTVSTVQTKEHEIWRHCFGQFTNLSTGGKTAMFSYKTKWSCNIFLGLHILYLNRKSQFLVGSNCFQHDVCSTGIYSWKKKRFKFDIYCQEYCRQKGDCNYFAYGTSGHNDGYCYLMLAETAKLRKYQAVQAYGNIVYGPKHCPGK